MSKPLSKKKVEEIFTLVFTRMRESDFEQILLRLKRQANFKCLQHL